ncbi:hypothetical protein BYT27DRAFT_6497647 [Phlegmacium glaucopus]|nr:hypothetical protein BYT27DRAFT_6497647 [Phlegmacium glaucopus]
MSHYRYPFRHSTYFTNTDHIWTSELPPMNSTEDILQDMFMRDRSRRSVDTILNVALLALKPKGTRKGNNNNNSRKVLKKVTKFITNWPGKRSDTSFLSFPP